MAAAAAVGGRQALSFRGWKAQSVPPAVLLLCAALWPHAIKSRVDRPLRVVSAGPVRESLVRLAACVCVCVPRGCARLPPSGTSLLPCCQQRVPFSLETFLFNQVANLQTELVGIHKFVKACLTILNQGQLSTVDLLARGSMKNAAKRDM